MSNTNYVNPDAPNQEVVDAGVRAMLGANQSNGYSNTYYYAGGYPQNPFATSQNVVSVPSNDSRANVGLNMYQIPQTQVYAYPPAQSQIAPPYAYGQAPTYSQIAPPYAYQMPQSQVQVPAGGYAGYPIGVDPSNYIFEYMKANTAPKNTWGQNYWTTPKPIDPPQIDWTQKPQTADPYAQYGMTVVPQIQMQPTQPMLPQGFAFQPLQESPLDVAKRNWKDL